MTNDSRAKARLVAAAALVLLLVGCDANGYKRPSPPRDWGLQQILNDWYAGRIIKPQGGYQGIISQEQEAAGAVHEPWMEASDGLYRRRAVVVGGIEIWAYDVVNDTAIAYAAATVEGMLKYSPKAVVDRQKANKHRLAIIGVKQNITQIPEYEPFKDVVYSDGRRFDELRGAGAVNSCHTSAVGEENVLELPYDGYWSENILIHEFGHGVMNLGFTVCGIEVIRNRYEKAYNSGVYKLLYVYMMSSEHEYFAVASQVWFDAVMRTDTTDLINNRSRMLARDPGLYDIMMEAYDFGTWRYPDICPQCNTKWDWQFPIPEPTPGTIPLVYTGTPSCDQPLAPRLTCAAVSDIRLPQGGSCVGAVISKGSLYNATGPVQLAPSVPSNGLLPPGAYKFEIVKPDNVTSSCSVSFSVLPCAEVSLTCKQVADVQLPQAVGGDCSAAVLDPSTLYSANGSVVVAPELPFDNRYLPGSYSFNVSAAGGDGPSCVVSFSVKGCANSNTTAINCKRVSDIQLPQAGGGDCSAATLDPPELYIANGSVVVAPELPFDNRYLPGNYTFVIRAANGAGPSCLVNFLVLPCQRTNLVCKQVADVQLPQAERGNCSAAVLDPGDLYTLNTSFSVVISPQLPADKRYLPGNYTFLLNASNADGSLPVWCAVSFVVIACPPDGGTLACKDVADVQLPQSPGGDCVNAELSPEDLYAATAPVVVNPSLPADNLYPAGVHSYQVVTLDGSASCSVSFVVLGCPVDAPTLTCLQYNTSLSAGACHSGISLLQSQVYLSTGAVTISPGLPEDMTFFAGKYEFNATVNGHPNMTCIAKVQVTPCPPTCSDFQAAADNGTCSASVSPADVINAASLGPGAVLSLEPPGPLRDRVAVLPVAEYPGGMTVAGKNACSITVTGADAVVVSTTPPQCVYKNPTSPVQSVCWDVGSLWQVDSCGSAVGNVLVKVSFKVDGGAKSHMKISSVTKKACLSLKAFSKKVTHRSAVVTVRATNRLTKSIVFGQLNITAYKESRPGCRDVSSP